MEEEDQVDSAAVEDQADIERKIMSNTSLCIRCGKQRIIGKIWKEKINGSLVTYTQTVCPDPECQKIVEEQLQVKKDKLEDIHQKSLERRKTIKRVRKAK